MKRKGALSVANSAAATSETARPLQVSDLGLGSSSGGCQLVPVQLSEQVLGQDRFPLGGEGADVMKDILVLCLKDHLK